VLPLAWRLNFDEIGNCPVVKRAVDEISETPCDREPNPRHVIRAKTAMNKNNSCGAM
jgi:hypothetical protein